MSLILEALRKSESERQMGQIPGLMSPSAQSSVRQEAPKWVFWVSGLLTVALVGGAAWWMGKSSQDTPPTGANQSTSAPPAQVAASTPSDDNTPPAEPEIASPPAATAPQSIHEPAAPPPMPSVPASQTPTLPPPPPAEPATEVVQAQTAVPTPAVASDASQPAAAAPAKSEPIARPPDINLMPSAQRSALPPLKLSVHVFHEQVDRRFAIIDGRRMLQGSQLNPQITIESIERDGVWLSINGSSWWLPR